MFKPTALIALALVLIVGRFSHAAAKLDGAILGYSAVWRDAAVPPEQYDFASLTHIARAFLAPQADGSIKVPAGYFDPKLELQAHQAGVKLLLSLGGGGASGTDWLQMASRPETRAKFLDALEKLLTENRYDGIDIDWEPPDPSKADGEAYGQLLRDLRARFPKALITTALPADKYQTRFTPWPDVIANVDYVNVMAYDYSGPWSGVARHASNLFPAGDYSPTAGQSAQEGIRYLTEVCHVPPAKLLLGMNFWGYRFRVDRLGDSFKKGTPDVTDDLSYPQIQALLQTGHYQQLWDAKAAMPYVTRTGGGSVICFENPESVRRKSEFAKGAGLGGMMIWNIGSDFSATQAPLMDTVVQAAGGSRHVQPRAMLELEIAGLREELGRHGAAAPELPEPLSAMPLERLEALGAHLRLQAATVNDEKWQRVSAGHR